MSAKRVLLTGAAGFVGANLARRLLDDGHDLHLVTKPGSDLWRVDAIAPHVTLHEVDLADRDRLSRIVGDVRPEWIFHLAAYGAYPTQTDARQMVETNISGTLNLITAALPGGFDAFVNAGSSSEYGFTDHAPTENERLSPNSDYAVTKASATMFCQSLAQRYNVHIQTLRLYSLYGPYEEPTRLMPTLIVRGLDGRLPPLVRREIARDFVYVSDVSDAFVRAAALKDQEPGEVYNVGTGIQTSLGDLVALARQVLDIRTEPEWASMPDRIWDTAVWVANGDKIRERLGWRPRHTLEAGFRLMVRWFGDNPLMQSRYATSISRG